MPAQATANSVIASEKRLIDVRQSCLRSSKMAEMSVPAWPIPIHHTKFTMANPQAIGNHDAPDADSPHEKPRNRHH